MTLVLSRSDIDGLLPMADVIQAIETAHADLSRGSALQAEPISLEVDAASASFLPMSALAERQRLAVVKFLADIPDNPQRHIPRQRSVAMLLSQETGECDAIIDGQILTRQRTAAASAVASRHLARNDSNVLGLVGAGNLAVEHVKALWEVLPINRVVVWSRSGTTIATFLERVNGFSSGIEVCVVESPYEVVARSDVVCTLTPAREPIIQGGWFSPGQHINAVGAPPRPDHREIDSTGMARAKVVVDSVATAMKKSGAVLLALAEGFITEEDVGTELGDVILGTAPGRVGQNDITLFNSVGIAMQDLAIGSLMVQRARLAGVGLQLDLSY